MFKNLDWIWVREWHKRKQLCNVIDHDSVTLQCPKVTPLTGLCILRDIGQISQIREWSGVSELCDRIGMYFKYASDLKGTSCGNSPWFSNNLHLLLLIPQYFNIQGDLTNQFECIRETLMDGPDVGLKVSVLQGLLTFYGAWFWNYFKPPLSDSHFDVQYNLHITNNKDTTIAMTLFRSIILFCGTDSIMRNIPHI